MAFIKALNLERNLLARQTQMLFREKMAAMTRAAIDEVGKAIARGDAATARWLLERVDIASVGKQIFERETDPELFPEDDEKIIDEIVERRVDDFLRNKRLGPMERLRLRAILEAEARKDLEPDGRAGV